MALFQFIILWGLFLGFGLFTIGIYKLLKSYPHLLDPDQYPQAKLIKLLVISFTISLLIGMLAVLPPRTYVSSNFQVLFSIITSFLWFFFYSILCFWIILYWKLSRVISTLLSVTQNLRRSLHLILGIMIAFFWLFDMFFWIMTSSSLFKFDFINLTYIIILILFLINQVILFFNVRKFSYLIYG